jgi:hypothetical protein
LLITRFAHQTQDEPNELFDTMTRKWFGNTLVGEGNCQVCMQAIPLEASVY